MSSVDLWRASCPALLAQPKRAYLDHAATAPRLQPALDAMVEVEAHQLGSPGRGVHAGVARAHQQLTAARDTIAQILGLPHHAVIFTSGTTAALNQAARGIPLRAGDRVLVTPVDHHANVLPWREAAQAVGATVELVPLTPHLRIDRAKLTDLLGGPTRVLALPHVSNVLGRRFDIASICAEARAHGVTTVVDGAQAVSTLLPNIPSLGCDLYAFGGHKLGAVAGAGVLCGRPEALARLRPWNLGGGMVDAVDDHTCTLAPLPRRLEAGTPPLGAIVSLAAALSWHARRDRAAVHAHLQALRDTLVHRLGQHPRVQLLCPDPEHPTVAFTMHGVHPHDIGSILDHHHVSVRVGRHCAEPLHAHLGVSASVRVSAALFNPLSDIDRLVDGLDAVTTIFP